MIVMPMLWALAAGLSADRDVPLAPALERVSETELAGTAEPGSMVIVMLDGEMAGTEPASKRGDWSFKPEHPLEEREHMVMLGALDRSGHSGPFSHPYTFVIERSSSKAGHLSRYRCATAPVSFSGILMLGLGLPVAARRRRCA